MNNKVIKLDADVVEPVKRLSAEVESRRAVIQSMIQNEMNLELPTFKKYQEEYTKFFAEYAKVKSNIEDTYVKPKETGAKRWDLNFNTRDLTIEFE